jgi:4-hydroxyproline epimerase
MVDTQLPISLEVIDSHTAGEPTRCVVSGGPDLGSGPLAERLELFRREHDLYRRAILCEPRGSDVLVGALLVQPFDPACAAGVIFFNNAGYLGMCGHGIIGVTATLAFLGRLRPGEQFIETPVGVVKVDLQPNNQVTFRNVPAYRLRAGVTVDVPGFGAVTGDVAWGGNWFFLVRDHPYSLDRAHLEQLTSFTWAIRQALSANKITGADGAEIDHIELHGPSATAGVNSRNFVLCPGKEYDRSPCGTGTSAELACLYAEGLLAPGQLWRQESIVGSIFDGRIRVENGNVLPSITGTAFITAESTIILDPRDAFCWGL